MDLIVVILLSIALWMVYSIYQAYNNIVKELKQIREKCVTQGISQKEGMIDYISENMVSENAKKARDTVLTSLQALLEKTKSEGI